MSTDNVSIAQAFSSPQIELPFIPGYGQRYFDPAFVAKRIEATNAMLDAFHRNDIPTFMRATTDFAMAGNGSAPVWAQHIVIMATHGGQLRLVNRDSFYGMTDAEIVEAIS